MCWAWPEPDKWTQLQGSIALPLDGRITQASQRIKRADGADTEDPGLSGWVHTSDDD